MSEFILYIYELGATGAAKPNDELQSEFDIPVLEVTSSFLILIFSYIWFLLRKLSILPFKSSHFLK